MTHTGPTEPGVVTMASHVRGVDHVGVTVPDIDEASRFFARAFGAEILYDLLPTEKHRRAKAPRRANKPGWAPAPTCGGDAVSSFVSATAPPSSSSNTTTPSKRAPQTASDLGVTHFALYVDDIDAVRDAILEAGGTALEGPTLLPGLESGDGNKWLYTIAPWGGDHRARDLPVAAAL